MERTLQKIGDATVERVRCPVCNHTQMEGFHTGDKFAFTCKNCYRVIEDGHVHILSFVKGSRMHPKGAIVG